MQGTISHHLGAGGNGALVSAGLYPMTTNRGLKPARITIMHLMLLEQMTEQMERVHGRCLLHP